MVSYLGFLTDLTVIESPSSLSNYLLIFYFSLISCISHQRADLTVAWREGLSLNGLPGCKEDREDHLWPGPDPRCKIETV